MVAIYVLKLPVELTENIKLQDARFALKALFRGNAAYQSDVQYVLILEFNSENVISWNGLV